MSKPITSKDLELCARRINRNLDSNHSPRRVCIRNGYGHQYGMSETVPGQYPDTMDIFHNIELRDITPLTSRKECLIRMEAFESGLDFLLNQ